jgi:hypothetical protein
MFGICLYGDSTTIRRKPFFNILAACVKEPSIVLEIINATSHLEKGYTQDSSYVANLEHKFLDWVF